MAAGAAPVPRDATLLRLCAQGALKGGLSVAADVRPADLVGPLCTYLGGAAARLKVLDARTEPPEVWVRLKQVEERWATPDVAALVTHLNRAYAKDASVPAIAWLGEWEEAFQLWCLSKRNLVLLMSEQLLLATNTRELKALGGPQPKVAG